MYLLWKGPSVLDGKEIICLATGVDSPSKNAKTGPVIQTYILREDISPVDARKTGEDSSICGDCIHRAGSCYVLVFQAPLNLWKHYKAGNYKDVHTLLPNDPWGVYRDFRLKDVGRNRVVRLGAYGDPAAVPTEVWDKLLSKSTNWLGYTHQMWHPNTDPAIRKYCQASVETIEQAHRARAEGWRTYRTRAEGESVRERFEVICPAQTHKATCAECLRCDGQRYDVVIDVHGAVHKRRMFSRTIEKRG